MSSKAFLRYKNNTKQHSEQNTKYLNKLGRRVHSVRPGLQTVVVLVAGLRVGAWGGLAVALELQETENLEVIAPLVDLLLLLLLSLMGGRPQGPGRAAGKLRQ